MGLKPRPYSRPLADSLPVFSAQVRLSFFSLSRFLITQLLLQLLKYFSFVFNCKVIFLIVSLLINLEKCLEHFLFVKFKVFLVCFLSDDQVDSGRQLS